MNGVPLNIDWQQILLHLLNFTILFGMLYVLLYKPVKDFMAGREEYYADMNSKAQMTLADAEASKETYASMLSNFDAEISAKRAEAGEEIEAERERRLSAVKEEADKILRDAKAQADKEKSKIVASAHKEISTLLSEAMEKLALGEPEADVFDKFLDAAEEENK